VEQGPGGEEGGAGDSMPSWPGRQRQGRASCSCGRMLRREARGGGDAAAASAPFSLLGCLVVAGAGGRRRRRKR
jgi:hypothetical protein